MTPTKNNLPETTRKTVVTLLNARLADVIDLFNQTKQAHWNVKGPTFIALHELFDDIAEHVEGYADELAERAVILGGTAEGTTQVVGKRTSLAEYPIDLKNARDHVEALSARLADFAGKTRVAIDESDKAGDKVTADLFTEITAGVDKDVWFLEAHLHG
jgi:starvation-inducible DNA-binding protein